MERLNQDHHHPKLEVQRLTCLSRESNPVGGEHSSKKLFEQCINSYLFGNSTYDTYEPAPEPS